MSASPHQAPGSPAEGTYAGTAQRAGRSRHPLIVIEVDALAQRDNPMAAVAYRVFEFTLASTVLLASLPIMLIEAAIIKLDSPGPALFFQERVGRSRVTRGSELIGRTDILPASGNFEPDKLYYVPTIFTFVKFRTMFVDARSRWPELYRYHFETHEEFRAANYKVAHDPRITRAGRWFRRTTLDELPNLWSVVTGKAALVGPRPEGPFYLPFYSAEEMCKFTVRSGITGLAVIKGRGNINIGGQIEWDLEYVRTRSVMLDLKILVITFWQVLTRRGAF